MHFTDDSLFAPDAQVPLFYNGTIHKTLTHCMLYARFMGVNDRYAEIIQKTEAVFFARKKAALRCARPQRENWRSEEREVLMCALESKVEMNADLQEQLLSTGDEMIVYVSDDPNMRALAVNSRDGTGDNMLGRLLVDLRTKIRERERRRKETALC